MDAVVAIKLYEEALFLTHRYSTVDLTPVQHIRIGKLTLRFVTRVPVFQLSEKIKRILNRQSLLSVHHQLQHYQITRNFPN